MRFLFLGDVVGRAGRQAVQLHLPALRRRLEIDFCVVNGENAAGGFGITETIYQGLLDAGADAVTLGNHAFDQREAMVFIARSDRLVRPLNYPPGTPGRGAALVRADNGADVLVINALARVFMGAVDCPFRAIDAELEACPLKTGADVVFVDFHGEATSEKQALAHHLDGRVSVLVGTHTHVPTSDARVLKQGTAYQTDTGMCGDYDSVIGMQAAEPVTRFLTTFRSERFEPAMGEATVCGLAVEIDEATGLAREAAPVRIGGDLAPTMPSFWPLSAEAH
ncbi:MAG: TIGR00282 family metallophosphoesterase [Pseudomonadota bacterium]